MFRKEDKELLRTSYFETISENESLFEIRSISTGHYWAVIPISLNRKDVYYMLLHKYDLEKNYHHQNDCGSVLEAVLNIISHDDYILKRNSHTCERIIEKYT